MYIVESLMNYNVQSRVHDLPPAPDLDFAPNSAPASFSALPPVILNNGDKIIYCENFRHI